MTSTWPWRLRIEPRFSVAASWSQRLETDLPWRSATAEEIAMLVGDAQDTSRNARKDVGLFALPRHLLDEWYRVMEKAAEDNEPAQGFKGFAAAIMEFLAFKGLSLPPGATLALLASAPGQELVVWDSVAGMRLWGGLNVGADAAWLVLGAGAVRVRVSLEAGEGFRLPDEPCPTGGSTAGKEESDLFVLIHVPAG